MQLSCPLSSLEDTFRRGRVGGTSSTRRNSRSPLTRGLRTKPAVFEDDEKVVVSGEPPANRLPIHAAPLQQHTVLDAGGFWSMAKPPRLPLRVLHSSSRSYALRSRYLRLWPSGFFRAVPRLQAPCITGALPDGSFGGSRLRQGRTLQGSGHLEPCSQANRAAISGKLH